jgi:hypothetical protein
MAIMNNVSNENELSKDDSAVSTVTEFFKTSYQTHVGADFIDKGIAKLTPERMLISGEIANQLIFTKPCMLPKQVWGGGVGFRSSNRMHRLMKRLEIPADTFPPGELFWLRFVVNPQEWVPHPYNVPHWALDSFSVFSRILNDKFAFSICKQWEQENNEAVDATVKQRLQSFQLQYKAGYNSGFAYVDIAVLINPPASELLQANTIWQHETQLADLVKTLFPDAIREYSPSWLGGKRLDIYVHSQRVAFEYQGEQHYQPMSHYGGAKGLASRQLQDQFKRELCAANGVTLIEWKYTVPISMEILLKELTRLGITGFQNCSETPIHRNY